MTTTRPVTQPGVYSEWQDSDGNPRPYYSGIAEVASSLGPAGLAGRWSEARRRVDLDAFTFYLDP